MADGNLITVPLFYTFTCMLPKSVLILLQTFIPGSVKATLT